MTWSKRYRTHFASSFPLQKRMVPEGLVDESGIPLNKGNIHIAKISPHSVLTGVHKSFLGDFTLFLRSHSQEMVSGGHMVLTIISRDRKADSSGNQSCTIWELLGITLNDMVQEIQNPLCLLFPPAETHGKYRRGKIGQVQSAVLCPYCRRS